MPDVQNDYRWFFVGLAAAAGFLAAETFAQLFLPHSLASVVGAVAGTMALLVLVRELINSTPRETAQPLRHERQVLAKALPAPALVTAPLAPPVMPDPYEPYYEAYETSDPAGSLDTAAQVEELLPLGFHGAVAEFKRRLLAQSIARCSGNRSEAARLLGLQRTYLYRLTRQLEPADSGDNAKLA